MKKKYTAPQSASYGLLWENGVALNIMSGENTPTLDNDNEILSNKKENPVWNSENKGGMWDGLNNN